LAVTYNRLFLNFKSNQVNYIKKTEKDIYAIVDENTDRIYIKNTDKNFIDLKYKELKEIYPNDNLSIVTFKKSINLI
jgi:hypothetical protein